MGNKNSNGGRPNGEIVVSYITLKIVMAVELEDEFGALYENTRDQPVDLF